MSSAEPMRLVSVSHNPGIRRQRWQHIFLDEPVDPLCGVVPANIFAPTVVRMGSDAVDCNNAAPCEQTRGQAWGSERNILNGLR